jgi:L-asparagine transporter-like permease
VDGAGAVRQDARDPDSPRDETRGDRLDRNLTELVSELRVALPGVQVLLGFLLVVPFNQRFATTTAFQRVVYFVTLLLAAGACVLLIAPSVHHRVRFREHEKDEIVQLGNRVAVIGLGLLALAVVGAVLLVTDFLFGDMVAVPTTIALMLLLGSVWYVLPLSQRFRDRDSRGRRDQPGGK